MKKYPLSGLLIVGLLMIPGVVRAEEESTAYMEMSSHYEAIRLSLLADSIEGMAEHARAIHQQASGVLEGLSAENPGVPADQVADFEVALRQIESAASNLSAASGLASAREGFFALTKPMNRYRNLRRDKETIVAYCSMAEKAWIQPEGELGNPYLGQEMPKCGEVVSESRTKKAD